MKGVVPPPDSWNPTQTSCKNNLAPGFRNEPQEEGIVKPSLRHACRQEQQPSIAIAIAQQSRSQQWTGQHEQWDEPNVNLELTKPEREPPRHHEESERDNDETRECADSSAAR